MPEALLVKIGHADCIGETILLTVRQPSQEGAVGKEVHSSCWEVYLVQSKLRYLKSL